MLLMRAAQTFYVPILPLYIRVLDASIPLFLVGLVTGVHRLGAVVINPFAGRWCDRTGYKQPFMIGVLVMSLACILASISFGPADLTLYLILSGVGYGTVALAALAYINGETTADNRATAMSLLSATTLAGAAIGPLPGGYIADAFSTAITGYRATFFSGGILLLLGGVYAFFLIRRLAVKPKLPEAKKTTFKDVIKHRGLLLTCISTLCFGVSHGAFLYFTVPLLGNSLGFSASQIGWIISGFGIGHIAGALVLGPLSDRVGRRKPFIFGAFFGLGLMIILFNLLDSVLLMVMATIVIGFITAPCCGIVPALASELVPRAPATAISLQKSSEQLGIFVGPVVGGALISALGYSSAIIGYGAFVILGSLIFLVGVNEPERSKTE
jgi:MFS family permease